MRISEIYASLQGEGLLAGTPSTFVRTSGCNLRCIWCDTPFTSWRPEGREMTAAVVLAVVEQLAPRHVVVTGGEPLLSAEVATFCGDLRTRGLHVTVETAGTVLPADPTGLFDLVSISPKLASSTPPADTPGGWASRHEAARRRDDIVVRLAAAAPHQVKFVVETPADLEEALGWLDALGPGIDRSRVFLMPQARTPEEVASRTSWLADECRRLGLRLAPRHHLTWFEGRRGT
ncbi:MAG: 7-carboxy-7-deazaguanine synthase QueE [Planctomycetaceae bacterium]